MTLSYTIDSSHALKLKPRCVKWSSQDLLKGITSQHITASPELKKRVHHDLWGDMCAEHDAENLWGYLMAVNIEYSLEFMEALREWRADEQNHYIGLRQICSTLYGIPEEEIEKQMNERVPNFKSIEHLLVDEFMICVVLAYDELVSARGYAIFTDDFKKFGPEAYVKWVRRSARDEALHYQNFVDIARLIHPERLTEAEKIINEISAYETSENYTYHATFLLDHTEETFERAFLLSCGATVLEALLKGQNDTI